MVVTVKFQKTSSYQTNVKAVPTDRPGTYVAKGLDGLLAKVHSLQT
jgi:hypothetical protein